MPVEDAQTLLLLGDVVSMIEVETVNAAQVSAILEPLAGKVAGRALVTDWLQMTASLFEALAVVRGAMFEVLSIIVMVAVFTILSSLRSECRRVGKESGSRC